MIIVFFGIGLYFFDNDRKLELFPFVFSGIGIYEFYKSYRDKQKWLRPLK